MSDDAYGFAMRHGTCSVTWLRDLDGLDWPLDRLDRDIEAVRRDIALVERMTTATTSREYAATPRAGPIHAIPKANDRRPRRGTRSSVRQSPLVAMRATEGAFAFPPQPVTIRARLANPSRASPIP